MYYVYILVCLQTRRSYVGHTDDLIRRFRCTVRAPQQPPGKSSLRP